jgi:murein DD-endopeptidase MepM/ murein hydrolase activator NlpD
MGASISTLKTKSLSFNKIKGLASAVAGGTLTYFTDSMTFTSSLVKDVQSAAEDASSIPSQVNKLKSQPFLRSILGWFTGSSSRFNEDDDLKMDIDVGEDGKSTISKKHVSESKENANMLSQNVIESSQKMVEASIATTAHIHGVIKAHSKMVTQGFQDVNKTLKDILKVVTTNTSALLETSYAELNYNAGKDRNSEIIKKFNYNDYKKLITKNFKDSEVATYASMAYNFITTIAGNAQVSTQDKISGLIGISLDMMNSIMPTKTGAKILNVKKSLKGVDDAVSELVLGSLVRLGEQRYSSNPIMSTIGRLFGVDTSRKEISTEKASLEVKAVPYDTISREALTSTIPGYLRQILIQLGGPDSTYDYRSRSWKTKAALESEFRNQVAPLGKLFNSTDSIKNTLGLGKDSQVLYDLLIHDISSNKYGPTNRSNIVNFQDSRKTEMYLMDLIKEIGPDRGDIAKVKAFAKRLGNLSPLDQTTLLNQAYRHNVERKERGDSFIANAESMNDDLSFINDSSTADKKHILNTYMNYNSGGASSVTPSSSKLSLVGINYTNAALYEIYKRLNQGINVFKVGEDNLQKSRFISHKKDYLPNPGNWKDKPLRKPLYGDSLLGNKTSTGGPAKNVDPNELTQEFDEDGNPIPKDKRLLNWGKKKGLSFVKAMFSGDARELKDVLTSVFREIGEVGKNSAKSGLSRLNESFGNVTGYLKHKLFGTEYTYNETATETGPNGETITKTTPVHIKANEKDGVFGYITDNIKGMAKGGKDYLGTWFKDVSEFFDYGDDSDEKPDVKSKRAKLLKVSVGAFAGAGIIAGPMGLITGALVANALSFTNIGSRIRDWLFGKKGEDDKRKGGILRKAVNVIVDPIRYQIHKTLYSIGSMLRDNILGPLSDIGYAIKERVANTASNVAKGIFTKLFSPVLKVGGSILKSMVHGAGSLFGPLVGGYGEAKRQKYNIPSKIIGGTLSGFASLIGGKAARSGLDERKRARKTLREERDKESGLFAYNEDGTKKKLLEKDSSGNRWFKNFHYWKEKLEEKRNNKTTTIADHMAEETADNTKQVADSTKEVADKTASIASILDEERIKGSSFKTHDQGIHDRLDKLIAHFTGKSPASSTPTSNDLFHESPSSPTPSPTTSTVSGDDLFATSVAGGIGGMVANDSNITNGEAKESEAIINEASKKNPNTSKIKTSFKSIMKMQKKNKDDEKVKEKSIWSKLFSGLGNILGGVGNILNQWKGIASLIGFSLLLFKDKLLDVRVNNTSDYLMGDILHYDKDAAGNDIVNTSVTGARNQYYLDQAKRTGINNITGEKTFKDVGWRTTQEMAQARHDNIANLRKNRMSANRSLRDVNKTSREKSKILKNIKNINANIAANKDPGFFERHSVVRGVTNVGASLGMGWAGGKFIGYGVKSAAESFGMNEEVSQAVGNIGGTVGQVYVTSKAIRNKGFIGFLKQKLIQYLDTVFVRLSKVKKITDAMPALGKLFEFLKKHIPKLPDSVFLKAVKKYGLDMTKLMGGQYLTLALATIGGVSGAITAENLFQVPPGSANLLMRVIAGCLGAAIWAAPVGWIIEIVDAILLLWKGITLKGWVAKEIYQILAPKYAEEKLEEKQAALRQHTSSYNQKFGKSLNIGTYNDMVNRGAGSQIFRGRTYVNETGEAVFDEAGAVATRGGLVSILGFGQQAYAKDAEGNVVRDRSGNPVMARDKYGSKVFAKQRNKHGEVIEGTSDEGYMNLAGRLVRESWRFFFGKNVYKTSKEGYMINDPETGDPIKIDEEQGLFGKIGTAAGSMAKGVGSWFVGGGEYFKSLFVAKPAYADDMVPIYDPKTGKPMINNKIHDTGLLGRVGQSFGNVAKNIGSFFIGKSKDFWRWLKGEDTDIELTDENGYKISKTAPNLLSKLSSAFSKTLNKISAGLDSWFKEGYELDENGNYLKDSKGNRIPKGGIGSAIKRTLQSLTGYDTFGNVPNEPSGGPDESGTQILSGSKGASKLQKETKPEVQAPAAVEKKNPTGNPLSKPYRISSYFGPRTSPYTGVHRGIDLTPKDRSGSADVGATADGTVIRVVTDVPDSHTGIKNVTSREAGNYVWYKTNDGTVIKNMHLKAGSIPSRVKKGAEIKSGEFIGKMGSTGKSSGPHLHYQIDTPSGKPINPIYSLTGDINKAEKYSSDFPNNVTENGYQDSSVSGSENKGKGFLAALFEKMTSIGKNFLSRITGGLIGSTSEEQDGAARDQGPTDPDATDVSTEKSGVSDTFKSNDKDTVAKIYNKLTESGYSPETSAGIIGNLQTESGGNINPAAYNPNDGNSQSYGIAQWRSGRGKKMINLVPNWQSNLDGQVKHLMEDLEDKHGWDFGARVSGRVGKANLHARNTEGVPGGLAEFKTLTDLNRATRLFDGAYEVSSIKHLKTRIGHAIDTLRRFKKEQDNRNITSDIKDPEVKQQLTDEQLENNRFTISDAMNNVINPTIPINVQGKYGGTGGPSDGAGGVDDFFGSIINSAVGGVIDNSGLPGPLKNTLRGFDIKNPKDIGDKLVSSGISMANSTLSNAINNSNLPNPLKSGLRDINFTSQSNDIGKKLMSSGVGMAKDLIRDNINLPGSMTDVIANNIETPEKIFDSSNMESLLQAVLGELKQITGNTNMSNQYLNGINQKEFKDTGLRESISNLKNIKKPAKNLPMNPGNTRLIQGIIKP